MASTVEIRHYDSMAAFQADAASMTATGWRIATQSSGSKISTAGSLCVALGLFLALAGFLLWFPLIVVGIVFVIIGAVSKQTTYTVTYQPSSA